MTSISRKTITFNPWTNEITVVTGTDSQDHTTHSSTDRSQWVYGPLGIPGTAGVTDRGQDWTGAPAAPSGDVLRTIRRDVEDILAKIRQGSRRDADNACEWLLEHIDNVLAEM